jgi:hypothetical protein
MFLASNPAEQFEEGLGTVIVGNVSSRGATVVESD